MKNVITTALQDGTPRSEIGICEIMNIETTSENMNTIRYEAHCMVEAGSLRIVEANDHIFFTV